MSEIPAQLIDGRLGLPSASNAERWMNCPASHLACAGYPETTSPAAEQGTKLHAAMEGKSEAIDALSDEERAWAQEAKEIEWKLKREIFKNGAPPVEMREERLFIHDEGAAPLATAKLDCFLAAEREGRRLALIIDYKFGMGEVPQAKDNKQLFVCAMAALDKDPYLDEIFVAIIQPRALGRKWSMARYTAETLQAEKPRLMLAARTAIAGGDGEFKCGQWCQYCPHMLNCREAKTQTLAVADGGIPVKTLSDAELARLLDACEVADKVVPALRKEAIARLAADASRLPGWTIPPPATRRSIKNASEAKAIAGQNGIEIDDFMQACSVAVGKLEKAFAKANALTGRTAQDAFNAAFGGTIETTFSAPAKPVRAAGTLAK